MYTISIRIQTIQTPYLGNSRVYTEYIILDVDPPQKYGVTMIL